MMGGKNSVALFGRRVLWGTAIGACFLLGSIFIIGMGRVTIPHQARLMRTAAAPGSRVQPRLVEAYGKLPLSFEINRGQTDARVKFLSRGSGYTLFLTGNEAVLALRKVSRQSKVESRKTRISAGALLFPSAALFMNRPVVPGFGPARFGSWGSLGLLPSALPESYSARGAGCGDKEQEMPEGLKGEPCAAPATGAVLRMALVGANQQAKVMGLEELPGKSNYFIGNDPKKWRTNVANYAKVEYQGIYPGIDVVY